jgi:hypothetical protein
MSKQIPPNVVEVPRDLLAMLVLSSVFAEGVLAEWASGTGPTFVAHEFARAVLHHYDHTEGVPPRPALVRTPLPSEMSARLDAMMAGLGVEPRTKRAATRKAPARDRSRKTAPRV